MAEIRMDPPSPNAPAPEKTTETPVVKAGDGSLQFGSKPPATLEEPKKPEPSPTERPAWLPENFETPEALVNSYKELQKKLSAPAKPPQPPKGGEPEPIDFDAIAQEYVGGKQLSAETLASLEKRGIPPTVIENYLKGQEALAARTKADLASAVGSEEDLDAILKWGQKGLTREEIDGYNALVQRGNLAAAKVLLKSFSEQYAAKVGQDGKSATADAAAGQSAGVAGYASQAEMIRDMKNPLYQIDPAYRRKVEQRLALTTAF